MAKFDVSPSDHQEQSPLKFALARRLTSVDPRLIVGSPETATKMFQQTTEHLIDAQWITSGEGDTILSQYR